MKDLNKIEEDEKASDNQNDSAKETAKAKRSGAVTEGNAESKETKVDNKKTIKTDAKIAVEKSSKKVKAETEPMVQNVAVIDLKEEQENAELDKKQKEKIKVIKKNTKKAEEKVDKLKIKVKKAKKKEVKKSKLNGLKEKLEKALDQLKTNIKKLKKAKK